MSIRKYLKQQVTHWPVEGSDGYSGFVFGDPRLLRCRWEEGGELVADENGEQFLSIADVYLMEDVSLGDFLALGDFTDEPDPSQVPGAFRVRRFFKNTDLRNMRVERKAVL